jgi:outer membrane immunogenic protein
LGASIRKCLLALPVVACAGASPTLAADIPAPVYKAPAAVVGHHWSGFYVGGNAGGARQRDCWAVTRSIVIPGSPPTVSTTTVNESCHNDTAVVSGGQAGVNWQTGNIVVGLEASGNWSNLKGSNVSAAFPLFTNETRTDAIGLLTGRVGIARGNALAYAKGGAALTHNKYTTFATANPSSFSDVTDFRWGWTVGGGFEYGFAPSWSGAIEYDYIDTGSKDEVFPSALCGASTCTERISQRIHMITLRLNCRFNPWIWH